MKPKNSEFGVLFVCLGNICRSPVARAVFRDKVQASGKANAFKVDSCGTGGWHAGESAHAETIRVAQDFGVSLADHRARQLVSEDLQKFNLVVAMDRSNLRNIERLAKANSTTEAAELILLRKFDPAASSLDVPDPWGCEEDEFIKVHQIIDRSCESLLQWLIETKNL